MGGEGHMLDMIRRLSEGREHSRLRQERTNKKLKHMNRAGEHYSLPDISHEEMGHIINNSKKKREKDSSYFVWGTLICMGALVTVAVILWAVFIKS